MPAPAAVSTAAGVPRHRRHDDWDAGRRWPSLLLIAALHVGGVLGLMQIQSVREAVHEVAPIMVGLITVPPEPLPPKIEPPPPKPSPVKPKPSPQPQMIVADTPAPAPLSAPPPEPAPVEEPPPPPPSAPAPPAPVIPPNFLAAYLDNPPPTYPSTSKRMGETGTVLLRVVVSAEGRAESVEIERSSGSSRLDRAALDAVRKWKFVPAKQGDSAVRAEVLVPINFDLSPS